MRFAETVLGFGQDRPGTSLNGPKCGGCMGRSIRTTYNYSRILKYYTGFKNIKKTVHVCGSRNNETTLNLAFSVFHEIDIFLRFVRTASSRAKNSVRYRRFALVVVGAVNSGQAQLLQVR